MVGVYQMSEIASGNVLNAYLEIDPSTQCCEKICLFLEGAAWREFSGVTLRKFDLVRLWINKGHA